MLTLKSKIRQVFGKKTKSLKKKDLLPAVLYGSAIKNLSLEIDLKEFEKIYKEAGESSLIILEVEGEKSQKFLVLIADVKIDPLTGRAFHTDFYQPKLEKEVEAKVPLIFEGVSFAVKDLGGTLVKNISEVEVKALPQKLPKEIKVNIEGLKSFENHILIKDLNLPEGVKILKGAEEIVAQVAPPAKEEELEKPIEEKVEEVKVIEKEKKEEVEEEAEK